MKTILLLLIATLSLSSCQRHLYYIYDTENEYCTLEINKKTEEMRYRASAYHHYGVPFVYLSNEGRSKSRFRNNDYFLKEGGSCLKFYTLHGLDYIDVIEAEEYCVLSDISFFSKCPYLRQGKDTLILSYGITQDGFGTGCNTYDVITFNWLPPYLVKAKKIDYKKFYPEVHKFDLKNYRRDKDKRFRKKNKKYKREQSKKSNH